MTSEGETPKKGFRLGIIVILLGVLLFLVALNVLNQAVGTLHELTRVEAERDQWQRPDEVLRALDMKEGSVVVDFGSGAGYFALKISKSVGQRGKVLAVDLRKLSLTFLWMRSLLQHSHNVSVIVGAPDNPHLGMTIVDSVLVANTYHELEDSRSILSYISLSLRPGGRLVIVDRAAESTSSHGIAFSQVESELAAGGFQVVRKDPDFIDRGDDRWWLIVAQKPR